MLHVRYATQCPLPPLSSLAVCLPAALCLTPCWWCFCCRWLRPASVWAHVFLFDCVCMCVWVLLCHADLFQQLFNVKCESTCQAGAKKKALKTVAYICAMASARALPTIRNVHVIRFCGTYIGNNNCGHMNHSSKWLKPTFQPINNSLTASLRSGGLVCLISLHIVHISCDLIDLLFDFVHALYYKYL